jgi:deoxyribonuclease-4
MGRLRFGPSGLHHELDVEGAVEAVAAAGFDAVEVGFVSGFTLDYPAAERLGEAARRHDVALSIHAPLFAFPGHPDEKKAKQALGALDRSAGLAAACGAEVVVIHPGFWLGRERAQTIDDVVASLEALRERLVAKERAVAFGLEVMGRVRELGSADDVVEIAARLDWVRPVLDFAHMHATSDGAYLDVEAFATALGAVDAVLEPGAPFHIHFSDIAYANRNETKHLPYGEGTLRAEPLGAALARFERPATVISEAPDLASTEAIKAALYAGSAASTGA